MRSHDQKIKRIREVQGNESQREQLNTIHRQELNEEAESQQGAFIVGFVSKNRLKLS